ncbi:hypothetical protein [Rhizobium sp. BR 362]|uniref:hypothetical protein n=1 Tax=Rhizobium sp. BR 362 TaxID=3040670 RepID=UPI002F410FF6
MIWGDEGTRQAPPDTMRWQEPGIHEDRFDILGQVTQNQYLPQAEHFGCATAAKIATHGKNIVTPSTHAEERFETYVDDAHFCAAFCGRDDERFVNASFGSLELNIISQALEEWRASIGIDR